MKVLILQKPCPAAAYPKAKPGGAARQKDEEGKEDDAEIMGHGDTDEKEEAVAPIEEYRKTEDQHETVASGNPDIDSSDETGYLAAGNLNGEAGNNPMGSDGQLPSEAYGGDTCSDRGNNCPLSWELIADVMYKVEGKHV